MKVLCIGNSFSEDASRYLHQIARADKFDLHVANLMIGGCFFYKHFRNFMSDAKDYTLGFNGSSTGVRVTMTEVLLSNEWDTVTIQQASAYSPDYNTYQPLAIANMPMQFPITIAKSEQGYKSQSNFSAKQEVIKKMKTSRPISVKADKKNMPVKRSRR